MFGQKPKTVDGVLAVFNKTIQDLNVVKANCEEAVVRCNDEIHRLTQERDTNQSEAQRALKISQKLEDLVNDE